MSSEKTLILDNGGWVCKVGYSIDCEPQIIPNCIMKAKAERGKKFICNEIDNCRDMSGLYYLMPFQKGFLVHWDVQRTVWNHLFSKSLLKVDPSSTNLIFTEPPFNFLSVQDSLDEIFFEEYQFMSLYRSNPSSLSAYNYLVNRNSMSCIVVDSGFSFTHVLPYQKTNRCIPRKIPEGIVRMDVGGKLLTNNLKEIISYRQMHVLDETYVINQCKEDCCFVTQDFYSDMTEVRIPNSKLACDYVLPDFLTNKRGFVKDIGDQNKQSEGEQVLHLTNERFTVPEILFRPSDIGFQQAGICESIAYSVNKCQENAKFELIDNLLLTGGNCLFPGFADRVYSEIRCLIDCYSDVTVTLPDHPQTYAWYGGKLLAQNPMFPSLKVTRAEYDENGSNICREKFDY